MTDKPEVMNGESLDIAAQRRAELKQLFPGVFTETKDAHGEIVSSIDFERLKAELGTFSDLYEGRRERYGMEWPGKRDCLKIIQEPSRAALKPCKMQSINWDTSKNVFIEGDNLEVLKLLQKSYYGKVKMIYIDPPYNTGNEFIYPDNYQESLDTYLAYAGLLDDTGHVFTTNTASEGRYHTKWLNMIYPRLYLARNLLKDDGAIFISIDDGELSNLKKVCDEIFGEENFKADIAWQKRYTRSNNTIDFTTVVEHILIYSKSQEFQVNLLPRSDEADARYTNPDNDPRGVWKGASFLNPASPQERPNLCYEIINPNTKQVTIPTTNAWRRSKSEFQKLQNDNLLYWGKDGKSPIPSIKMFLSEARGLTPTNFWQHDYAGNTDDGTRDLQSVISNKVFDNPKPIQLVKRMIEHVCQDNDIILDFFAGSGTTGHAVLEHNLETGKRNRFILVQLPEICYKESNAVKAGFKKISDITVQRLSAVLKKISESEHPNKSDELDLGFKFFRLNHSCFKSWNATSQKNQNDVQSELDFHVDNVLNGVSHEEILFEILIKAGFEPTDNIIEKSICGKTVFSVADGGLLISLEDEISSEFIDEILKLEPTQFICLDKSFHGNDQLKANTSQAFKSRSARSGSEMVFKVV